MKNICTILLIISTISLLPAQSLELAGGFSNGRLEAHSPETSRNYVKYYGEDSFFFYAGVSDIKLSKKRKWLSLDVYLSMDHYKGNMRSFSSGLEIGERVYADVEKRLLGIEVYPLNLKFFKEKIKISLGGEYSTAINNRFSGRRSISSPNDGVVYIIEQDDPSYFVNDRFGLNLRGIFLVEDNEHMSFGVLARVKVGLTEAYRSIPEAPYSSFLGIGLSFAYKLK